VQLVPLYTPTRVDDQNVSQRRIFFGGVSVYLEQYIPFFRRSPAWLDRMWDSPLLLKLLSGVTISSSPQQLAEMTLSVLRGEDGYQRKEFEKLLEWLAQQPRPEVVSIHDSMLIRLAAPIKRALGCPVVCTLQGEDLFLQGVPEPHRSEAIQLIRAHVHDVDAFVAVSEYYADFMAGWLGVPRSKVRAIPVGMNFSGYGPGERLQVSEALRGPVRDITIGYLARIAPEKGLHILCEAYRILRQELGLPKSRLVAAGWLGREHQPYLRRVEARMKQWGLGAEFAYHGSPDREEKIRFLQRLDIFSVPGSFPGDPEIAGRDLPGSKAMFLLEAMACGVPVVQPRRGAFPEIVEKTGGGLLVEWSAAKPASRALAEGIHALWQDPARAEALGRAGCAGVARHYDAAHLAERSLALYQSLLGAAAQPPVAAVSL
jgi:glycosyltransferase involved in cell wall biosynthesis